MFQKHPKINHPCVELELLWSTRTIPQEPHTRFRPFESTRKPGSPMTAICQHMPAMQIRKCHDSSMIGIHSNPIRQRRISPNLRIPPSALDGQNCDALQHKSLPQAAGPSPGQDYCWSLKLKTTMDQWSSLKNIYPLVMTHIIYIYIYPLVMTNSSPWFVDGPNRNRWFSQRQKPPFMVGIFHGKLLVILLVITRFYNQIL